MSTTDLKNDEEYSSYSDDFISEYDAKAIIKKEVKELEEKKRHKNGKDSGRKQGDKTKYNAEAASKTNSKKPGSNKSNSQNKAPSKQKAARDTENTEIKAQMENARDADDNHSSSSDENDGNKPKQTKKENNQKKEKEAEWVAPYKEFKQNTIKQRLIEGIKKQDPQMLNRAIKDAETAGMKKNDKDLVAARNNARALEERNKLREAVKKGKADAIKNEVHIISKNMAFYVEYCPGIQREVFEARCKLEDIERAKKKESDVHIVINQHTMSAISGFKNPPKKVHRVMQGAFLLLGYDLDKTSKWNFITSKCNASTLKDILDFDIAQLHPDIAATAERVLSEQNLKNLQSISEAAVSFYVWGMGTAEECKKVKGKGKVIGVKQQNEIFSNPKTKTEQLPASSKTNNKKEVNATGQDDQIDKKMDNSQTKESLKE